jgi:hypothetical protein
VEATPPPTFNLASSLLKRGGLLTRAWCGWRKNLDGEHVVEKNEEDYAELGNSGEEAAMGCFGVDMNRNWQALRHRIRACHVHHVA